MKTVVSSQQVAHLWANKSQPSARNSNGSFYFEGDTIYSYGSHFPVARHITYKGKAAILFTVKDYSVTTTSHKTMVRQAIDSDARPQMFFVCGDDVVSDENPVKLAKLADKWRAEQDEAKKQNKRDSARRIREAKKREAKINEEWPNLVIAWRGHGADLPRDAAYRFAVALRVSKDGKRIETSKGAEISASFARKAWDTLRTAKNSGDEINLPEFEWGNFTGLSLQKRWTDDAWFLKVGCHLIPFSEVEIIAEKLGIANPVAAPYRESEGVHQNMG